MMKAHHLVQDEVKFVKKFSKFLEAFKIYFETISLNINF